MAHESPPYEVAVFLVPQYSQLSLAALVEPLRLANTVAGKRLYHWTLCSAGAERVTSSSGFTIEVDCDIAAIERCDALFIVASYDVLKYASRATIGALRRIARKGVDIGALDAGSYLLAEAGLLDGRRATIHWDDLEDFRLRYPRIEVVADRFVVDGKRATTSGSLPSFDFTLDFIRRRDGLAIASNVSGNFIYDQAQPGSQPQFMISVAHLRERNPKIAEAIKLMEQSLQEPLDIKSIASAVGFSERTFLRRFQALLGMSPGEYYRTLRLDLGRRLIESSDLSIAEIAVACGFETRGAFTRAFRETFGAAPTTLRNGSSWRTS